MKQFYFWFVLGVVALLGGCRLDGNALLGGESHFDGYGDESVQAADAYEVCREQRVIVENVQNASGCATPANLAELMPHMETGPEGTVRFVFEKMWDGTFPKMGRLQYRTRYYPSVKSRDLTCKIVVSAPSVRAYECAVEGAPASAGGDRMLFASMVLGHDTCTASATFRAAYHYPLCETQGGHYEAQVYFNRQLMPEFTIPAVPAKP